MNAFITSAPSQMDSESLGAYVQQQVTGLLARLADLKSYVEELWQRFDNGETIMGCRTRKEYCDKLLHRDPRTVRYMLDGGNHKRQAETVSAPTPEIEVAPVPPTTFEPITCDFVVLRRSDGAFLNECNLEMKYYESYTTNIEEAYRYSADDEYSPAEFLKKAVDDNARAVRLKHEESHVDSNGYCHMARIKPAAFSLVNVHATYELSFAAPTNPDPATVEPQVEPAATAIDPEPPTAPPDLEPLPEQGWCSMNDSEQKQLKSAWKALRRHKTKPKSWIYRRRGLAFGKLCYELQCSEKKPGRPGKGRRPLLDEVGIPQLTAYRWIDRYKESIGIKPAAASEGAHDPEPPATA